MRERWRSERSKQEVLGKRKADRCGRRLHGDGRGSKHSQRRKSKKMKVVRGSAEDKGKERGKAMFRPKLLLIRGHMYVQSSSTETYRKKEEGRVKVRGGEAHETEGSRPVRVQESYVFCFFFWLGWVLGVEGGCLGGGGWFGGCFWWGLCGFVFFVGFFWVGWVVGGGGGVGGVVGFGGLLGGGVVGFFWVCFFGFEQRPVFWERKAEERRGEKCS